MSKPHHWILGLHEPTGDYDRVELIEFRTALLDCPALHKFRSSKDFKWAMYVLSRVIDDLTALANIDESLDDARRTHQRNRITLGG